MRPLLEYGSLVLVISWSIVLLAALLWRLFRPTAGLKNILPARVAIAPIRKFDVTTLSPIAPGARRDLATGERHLDLPCTTIKRLNP